MPLTTTKAFSSSAVSVDFLVYKRTRATDSFLRPMAWKYFSLPFPFSATGSAKTFSVSKTLGLGAVFFTAFLVGLSAVALAEAFLVVVFFAVAMVYII